MYIPFVGGAFSPDRKLFPKYYHGIYKNGSSTMIVNSGLSKGETGFRFLNKPEIAIITLKSE